jgi:hypothetical protein
VKMHSIMTIILESSIQEVKQSYINWIDNDLLNWYWFLEFLHLLI